MLLLVHTLADPIARWSLVIGEDGIDPDAAPSPRRAAGWAEANVKTTRPIC